MDVVIRRAEERDVPAMLKLVKELAQFEREPDAVVVTEEEMADAGFGGKPVWFGWVAEMQVAGDNSRSASAAIVGMAVCYERYSTWKGRALYLEDLVVTGKVRGHGIGEGLFKACAAHAVEQKFHHMLWQVLDWNEDAIRFYRRFDAEISDEWLNGRLYKEQMAVLLSRES